MTTFAVDLVSLDNLICRMEHFQRRLTGTRDDVEQRFAALHLEWTGEAAAAHTAAHRLWDGAAAQAQEALAALRSIASTAHANYDAAIAANRRMWSG